MTDAEAYGGTGHRDGRTLFDAVLHPHRSPGHIGFLVLMLCVSLVSFTGGLIFVAVGAWPVLGFLGANVVLITIAFKLNYRSGRQMERLRLTLERLEIERISASGRLTRWEFPPYWVQVSLSDAGEQHSRLTLSSHGRELTVGSFLSPDERQTLCTTLNNALARCRCAPQAAS